MSSTGTTTSSSIRFVLAGCTTVTGREPPRNEATSAGGRTVADSPIRCARPAGARACLLAGAAQRVKPFKRQRQVRAPLGPRHGMDLIDDDRLDPAQRLPRLRGEQQKQRFRRGDEDVGRPGRDLAPLLRGGVPCAHRHLDVRLGQPEPPGRLPDPGERRPQVPLDVHGERLERRHVKHPRAPLAIGGRRRGGEPVDRPEERGEGLARPGRRDDQGVGPFPARIPPADGPPGLGLRLRGHRERALEPRPGRGREPVKRRRAAHRVAARRLQARLLPSFKSASTHRQSSPRRLGGQAANGGDALARGQAVYRQGSWV